MDPVSDYEFGHRSRIFKRLRSPGIDSNESIPPAYITWRDGTSNRVVVPARQAWNRFLGSLKGLQIKAWNRFLGSLKGLQIRALL
jgi:hypothetical protein